MTTIIVAIGDGELAEDIKDKLKMLHDAEVEFITSGDTITWDEVADATSYEVRVMPFGELPVWDIPEPTKAPRKRQTNKPYYRQKERW